MHPAFSVLLLTTLIGVGQGLFLALYTGQLYALANLLPSQDPLFYAGGSLLGLVLLAAGLVASFFHLGRPERAWRSASRWRSSWLSREVIVLPLLMVLMAAYGAAHYLGFTQPLFTIADVLSVDPTLLIGLLAAVAVFALFVCTAMIYAEIEFIEEWHSPLTVANFTFLGIASGFMLAAAYSAWLGNKLLVFFGTWAVIATLIGFLGRTAALLRNEKLVHKSDISTAIGVRHTLMAQVSQGATGGSFNTREFFHGRSEGFARSVRILFLILAFPLPVGLIALSYWTESTSLPWVAFAVQYVGLLAERWSFFAEVKHPQNLYYQQVA